MGTPKLHSVEYFDVASDSWRVSPVAEAFVLAICNVPPVPDRYDLSGLNIAIVFADDPSSSWHSKKAGDAFAETFSRGVALFTVYLIGEHGIKIPVKIHAGNGWNDPDTSAYKFGYDCPTSCYFGYLAPTDFDTHKQGVFWERAIS